MNRCFAHHQREHDAERIDQIGCVRHSAVWQERFGAENTIHNAAVAGGTGDDEPGDTQWPCRFSQAGEKRRLDGTERFFRGAENHRQQQCRTNDPAQDHIFLREFNSIATFTMSSDATRSNEGAKCAYAGVLLLLDEMITYHSRYVEK